MRNCENIGITEEQLTALRSLVYAQPCDVVILTHANPDGDAVGSSMAWGSFLRSQGHRVTCIVPNKYPYFLDWMEGIHEVKVYKDAPDEVATIMEEADVIYCLDFNQIQRLEGLSECIERNTHAKTVLIDHHLEPPHIFDVELSFPKCSSTSYLVYLLICELDGTDGITKGMAENLYVGIMTDTGNFSFSNLTPGLFYCVAELLKKGIDIPYINRMVYNSYSAERLKLLGHSLDKMRTVEAGGEQIAWITLSEAELRRFKFRPGDSEGFVNYPLTIRGLALSAIFIETHKFIRISFRSRIDVDCSAFARKYFDGGGHKNAAGGKAYDPMDKTVERFQTAVKEFFGA